MRDVLPESRPLILTIDDDDMMRLMLKDVLSCEGFDVLTANDARLSLEVVAEGVENEQQLDFLRQHACDIVQGYFYSRPLPPEEFSQFVQRYGVRS